jgi:hypothetical protein
LDYYDLLTLDVDFLVILWSRLHAEVFLIFLADKSSTWGYDNGLKSMVTTLLQFGIVGYPFVLPDMIGGE